MSSLAEELLVIGPDGTEWLCSSEDMAIYQARQSIVEYAALLARQHPADRSRSGQLISTTRELTSVPAAGYHLALLSDDDRDEYVSIQVLWANHLRWLGFKHGLRDPGRPYLADELTGGPLRRGLVLEGFEEVTRPV
jgi:hypothetical protein